jgi:hypothetical protein
MIAGVAGSMPAGLSGKELLLINNYYHSCQAKGLLFIKLRIDLAHVNASRRQRFMAAAQFFAWSFGRGCHTMMRNGIPHLEIAFKWAARRSGSEWQKFGGGRKRRGPERK